MHNQALVRDRYNRPAPHRRRYATEKMNKDEAIRILDEELETYRQKSHAELVELIDNPKNFTKPGTTYQIVIQAVWDDKPQGDVRVLGSIDDGGIRAFFPITRDFIKNPKEEFVGE